jgi:hypothetical protein
MVLLVQLAPPFEHHSCLNDVVVDGAHIGMRHHASIAWHLSARNHQYPWPSTLASLETTWGRCRA